MYWIYLICSLALGLKMLAFPNLAMEATSSEIVEAVITDTGVPNAVSGIILRNRLFDTIFEVVVFTLASMGVGTLLKTEKAPPKVRQFTDETSRIMAQLGAMLATLIAIELSIRGHLSPGGGFAAGVAGGTAIGLIAITSKTEEMQDLYKKWRVPLLEKLAVILFIGLASLVLLGVELGFGTFDTLLSGGWMPMLNILVAMKVAFGAWAIVLAFIRARGLF